MDETTVKAPTAGVSADSLFQMGLKLSTGGEGVEVDSIAALALFDMAARSGSIEAKIYRRELSDEMNPDDVLEARRLAREWLGSVEPAQH
jgi:uncharacterized protein